MKAVVRGTAVAAVLVLGLTGCDDGGDKAAGGAKSTGSAPASKQPAAAGATQSPTDGQQEQNTDVSIDAAGMYYALPTNESVSDRFSGGDPVVVQGKEALPFCTEETGSPCAGFQVAGHKEMESADETRVEFTLFTFASTAEAGVAVKSMAEKERAEAVKNGYPTKPVTVKSDADETEAVTNGSSAHVYLRIGPVVSHIFTSETEAENLEYAAKVQIGRVKEVSAGKNPDR
ncbi:hypothetical protein [Streptomyces sp. NPDC058548]|uniref:hypothetical protein n=1 Tax=Streptomyces sp. NPDC058548 TaxID=3346545 RepID=UPI00365E0170